MNFNQFDVEPKEMMSESLQDAFEPEKETSVEDQIIVASLVVGRDNFFTGNLLGVEFGENPKIDMKTLTKKSFEFIGSTLLSNKTIQLLVLALGDEIVQIPGPFQISNLKIVEVDYENKACVLAIDLFKVKP